MDPGAWLEALASTGTAVIAAGARLGGTAWEAALWRSTDGLHWTAASQPNASGGVNAVAAHGSELLAIGGSGTEAGSKFVWSSSDDGRSWTSIAESTDLFGPSAPQTGRPFVTGLRWNDSGQWIASGGDSDGHASVWTSKDGVGWTQTLASGSGADSVNVVEDGNGALLAYSTTLAWSSTDGRAWTAVPLALPEPYVLNAVAPQGSLAISGDSNHTPHPTPLLRSDNTGRTWSVDSSLLDHFPGSVALGITHAGGLWVVTGTSGLPQTNHPDAWISTDAKTWHAMPTTLNGPAGGTLALIASLGPITIMMGTAPELGRYYALDSRALRTNTHTTPCPNSIARRLVEGTEVSADALPNIANSITDRVHVSRVLTDNMSGLQQRYPSLVTAEVGPSFGRAWVGTNGGAYNIVNVDDYSIVVHLRSTAACPQGSSLYTTVQDVPLFFVVDT